ncbi:MAG: hypothetical protein ACFFBT_14225 [Promethearchaeota archaeon]
MAFKSKIWIFCLIGAIVVLIGYFTPYVSAMGIINMWLFGFISSPYGGYMIPWTGSFLMVGILGIIIVALAALTLVMSFLMKSREDNKVMKILVIIFGAVILIMGLLPPLLATGYYAILFSFVGIGYYLIIIGGALLILFGILGMVLK